MSKQKKRRVSTRFILSATACIAGLCLLLIFREQYVNFRNTVRGEILSAADSIVGGTALLDGIRLGKDYSPMSGQGQEVDESDVSTPENTGGEYSFPSDVYPYRALLDSNAQSVYNQVYSNAFQLNAKRFTLTHALTETELHDVMSAVYNDHPELFWLDTAYSYGFLPSGKIVTVALSYNEIANRINDMVPAFDEALNAVVTQASGKNSDIEREIYVHDYLMETVEYDEKADMNQSAYSALVGKRSVCAGYSRAFQLIMQKLGIPCYYCTGLADGGEHAWNIISIGGAYYNIDVSWDDALTSAYRTNTYTYFNVPDNTFLKDHQRDVLSAQLPACNGSSLAGTALFSGGTGASANDSPAAAVQETKRKTYQSLGYQEKDVLTSLSAYNAYCQSQLVSLGTGSHSFQMVLRDASLLSEVYDAARNDAYLSGYVEGAVAALGLHGCSVKLELQAETLDDGYILLTEQITLTEKERPTAAPTSAPTPIPVYETPQPTEAVFPTEPTVAPQGETENDRPSSPYEGRHGGQSDASDPDTSDPDASGPDTSGDGPSGESAGNEA